MQGVLSTTHNQAVDDGMTPSNPASRVKKAVKREQAPMRFTGPGWREDVSESGIAARSRQTTARVPGSPYSR